jgi:hypothetical protein
MAGRPCSAIDSLSDAMAQAAGANAIRFKKKKKDAELFFSSSNTINFSIRIICLYSHTSRR